MSGISRNASCPCGTGKKYKQCCLGKVDWDAIDLNGGDRNRHLSIRGRNLAFIELICELLLLDSDRHLRSLEHYKKAFTARNVRRLNEGIARIWPPDLDINAALRSTRLGVSGLYVGDYGKDQLLRGIVRHSAYASKLLICDPFIYPLSVREEYSPIHNPDQHRSQTLRNVNLWLSLIPWIQEGLVEVIRTPSDFDHRLQWESMKEQEAKFEASQELAEAAEITVKEMMARHSEAWKFRDLVLTMPDGALLAQLQRVAGTDGKITKEDLLAYVHRRRAADPDFLEPIGPNTDGQLQMVFSGASYNIACLVSELTGSYLVTDLHVKWKEIELDRRGRAAEVDSWSPFAKVMHGANLKYLNDVSLEDALSLRKDGRLEDLRAFLRRVWNQACDTSSYADVNGQLFADELQSEIHKAEDEWAQIDRDLLKNSAGIGAGLATAATLIGSGQGEFLAAATLVAGIPLLAASAWQRRSFPDKFPAAFFLRLG
jgi:hypothetical protein